MAVRAQIGNAVPPLMAKAIADKIFKELTLNKVNGKNKISNFLNPDISYLLGLITGRGQIVSNSDVKKLSLILNIKAKE